MLQRQYLPLQNAREECPLTFFVRRLDNRHKPAAAIHVKPVVKAIYILPTHLNRACGLLSLSNPSYRSESGQIGSLGSGKARSTAQAQAMPPANETSPTQKSEPKRRSPLVVVGSVNADIYVEVDRLPKPGETISARTGQTLPGGKGANQAACAARLGYPTFFVGQVGQDANAALVRDSLTRVGVRLDHLSTVAGPTGHAVVMLQPGGQNSIIIVGGANVMWPRLDDGISRLSAAARQLIRAAGALLLQREVPEALNLEAAKIARSANVPVILDAGGADTPIADELLRNVTVFSPNETELARLTGMPTSTRDQVVAAARSLQGRGVAQVLVKLGEEGSLLVTREGPPLPQPCLLAPTVVDTTGAGDTFTAAYAVAIIEGQRLAGALEFAAAAASLCVRGKGAMPSMPERRAVAQLVEEGRTAQSSAEAMQVTQAMQ